MSAINEISLRGVPSTMQANFIRDIVRDELWLWILRNGEQSFKLRIWFIRATFKIRDLHPVFELLLGPKPVSV